MCSTLSLQKVWDEDNEPENVLEERIDITTNIERSPYGIAGYLKQPCSTCTELYTEKPFHSKALSRYLKKRKGVIVEVSTPVQMPHQIVLFVKDTPDHKKYVSTYVNSTLKPEANLMGGEGPSVLSMMSIGDGRLKRKNLLSYAEKYGDFCWEMTPLSNFNLAKSLLTYVKGKVPPEELVKRSETMNDEYRKTLSNSLNSSLTSKDLEGTTGSSEKGASEKGEVENATTTKSALNIPQSMLKFSKKKTMEFNTEQLSNFSALEGRWWEIDPSNKVVKDTISHILNKALIAPMEPVVNYEGGQLYPQAAVKRIEKMLELSETEQKRLVQLQELSRDGISTCPLLNGSVLDVQME